MVEKAKLDKKYSEIRAVPQEVANKKKTPCLKMYWVLAWKFHWKQWRTHADFETLIFKHKYKDDDESGTNEDRRLLGKYYF